MSAFSGAGLGVKVELNLGGTWTDVTSQAYVRDRITIKRGQANEGQATDPTTCDLTFNNRNGQFSPRNPSGPYYGLIGRNTPLRVSANIGSVRLRTPNGGATDASAAIDNAGLHITGDIDIRFDGNRDGWGAMNADPSSPTGFDVSQLVTKALPSNNGFIFAIDRGFPVFFWSSNGTTLNALKANVPLTQTAGRQALRVTFQVNNGAGGCTATFYTAPTAAGPWTQLGDPRIAAFTTSIFASTANLVVQFSDSDSADAQIYSAQVLSGISGTAKANPDFTAQPAGTTTFSDAAGNTWVLFGGAAIDAWRTRFSGEVSSWPSTWDLSGNDVAVSVEGAGILRRLGQGTAPLRSPYYRGITSRASSVVAYWPVEDSSGATQIAAGIAGASAMSFTGAPQLAANSTSFMCSEALPTLAGASLTGTVPSYTVGSNDSINLRFLMAIPAGGLAFGAVIASLYCGPNRFDLVYGGPALNTLTLNATNLASGASVGTSTAVSWGDTLDGGTLLTSVEIHATTMGMATLAPNSNIAQSFSGAAYTGGLGTAKAVVINPGPDTHALTVGHVSVQQSIGTLTMFELATISGTAIGALNGYAGEQAALRFLRLCVEEGVGYSLGGGCIYESAPMGAQASEAAFVDLVQACINADIATLVEPREKPAIRLRNSRSQYSQPFVVALPYGDTNALAPSDDDMLTRNDITISRTNGSNVRLQQTTGPLNIATPPAGVGVYSTSADVDLFSDAQLSDYAYWQLHLGTYDATRYPTVGLELASSPFTASTALTSQVLDLDQGDMFCITGLPAWMPPDNANLMAIGFTEVLEPYGWALTINAVPADPWITGIYDQTGNTGTRYSSDGSTLASSATSGATSLSVATPSGPLWTGTDAPFDIRVAGERITVTAVAGASSPQTFTVTRSVNGVVKAQASGAAVELFQPAYYAI